MFFFLTSIASLLSMIACFNMLPSDPDVPCLCLKDTSVQSFQHTKLCFGVPPTVIPDTSTDGWKQLRICLYRKFSYKLSEFSFYNKRIYRGSECPMPTDLTKEEETSLDAEQLSYFIDPNRYGCVSSCSNSNSPPGIIMREFKGEWKCIRPYLSTNIDTSNDYIFTSLPLERSIIDLMTLYYRGNSYEFQTVSGCKHCYRGDEYKGNSCPYQKILNYYRFMSVNQTLTRFPGKPDKLTFSIVDINRNNICDVFNTPTGELPKWFDVFTSVKIVTPLKRTAQDLCNYVTTTLPPDPDLNVRGFYHKPEYYSCGLDCEKPKGVLVRAAGNKWVCITDQESTHPIYIFTDTDEEAVVISLMNATQPDREYILTYSPNLNYRCSSCMQGTNFKQTCSSSAIIFHNMMYQTGSFRIVDRKTDECITAENAQIAALINLNSIVVIPKETVLTVNPYFNGCRTNSTIELSEKEEEQFDRGLSSSQSSSASMPSPQLLLLLMVYFLY